MSYQCLRYQELTVSGKFHENQLKMDELTATTNFLLLIQLKGLKIQEKRPDKIFTSGPDCSGCSKLMTLLVNVLLKFQTLLSNTVKPVLRGHPREGQKLAA